MSTLLFDLFKFSKLLDLSNGQMSLMNTPVNVVPTYLMCEQQRMLIEQLGFKDAYEKIYAYAKKGSFEYNSEFMKREKFSDKRKTIDWQTKLFAFAGWGELDRAFTDFNNTRFIAHFKNAPYPKSYGPAKYPVDFIGAGLIAGGLSALVGTDLDSVETKCVSRGDAFCEIETNKPDITKKLKAELWKTWGIA